MTLKKGTVIAVFDKNGSKGYRIKDEFQEEDWYILNKKDEINYNPQLKTKQVEFDFVIEGEGKGKKNVLIFIKEVGNEIKEEKVEVKEVTTHNIQPRQYSDEERREMARSFANIRAQSLNLTLQLYPDIKTFSELVNKSLEIEEYIKSGMFK